MTKVSAFIKRLRDSSSKSNFHLFIEIHISEFVKSMSSGIHISNDLDYQTEYSKYLEEKYR